MALEDLQSTFGPYNKKGVKGTGEIYDTLAFESAPKNTGVVGGNKPTGPDVFGNIPPERSGE
mgnify:CR=1 FL=1